MKHISRTALFLTLTSSFFILLYGFELFVLGPWILPEDPCFYHTNPEPWWVELFYISNASNGHPDGFTLPYFTAILGLSALSANLITKRLKKVQLIER